METDLAYAPTGAVNIKKLGKWLRMSRNTVAPFAQELGVEPLSGKYLWGRLLSSVLGIDSPISQYDGLMQPMMTLAQAADDLGMDAQDLKEKIEDGRVQVPPLFVFGQRRRRFIRSQFQAFSRNPRGYYPAYHFNNQTLVTLPKIAVQLGKDPQALADLWSTEDVNEPMHVVLQGGEKKYFRASVLKSACDQDVTEEQQSSVRTLPFSGGILGAVARSQGVGCAS